MPSFIETLLQGAQGYLQGRALAAKSVRDFQEKQAATAEEKRRWEAEQAIRDAEEQRAEETFDYKMAQAKLTDPIELETGRLRNQLAGLEITDPGRIPRAAQEIKDAAEVTRQNRIWGQGEKDYVAEYGQPATWKLGEPMPGFLQGTRFETPQLPTLTGAARPVTRADISGKLVFDTNLDAFRSPTDDEKAKAASSRAVAAAQVDAAAALADQRRQKTVEARRMEDAKVRLAVSQAATAEIGVDTAQAKLLEAMNGFRSWDDLAVYLRNKAHLENLAKDIRNRAAAANIRLTEAQILNYARTQAAKDADRALAYKRLGLDYARFNWQQQNGGAKDELAQMNRWRTAIENALDEKGTIGYDEETALDKSLRVAAPIRTMPREMLEQMAPELLADYDAVAAIGGQQAPSGGLPGIAAPTGAFQLPGGAYALMFGGGNQAQAPAPTPATRPNEWPPSPTTRPPGSDWRSAPGGGPPQAGPQGPQLSQGQNNAVTWQDVQDWMNGKYGDPNATPPPWTEQGRAVIIDRNKRSQAEAQRDTLGAMLQSIPQKPKPAVSQQSEQWWPTPGKYANVPPAYVGTFTGKDGASYQTGPWAMDLDACKVDMTSGYCARSAGQAIHVPLGNANNPQNHKLMVSHGWQSIDPRSAMPGDAIFFNHFADSGAGYENGHVGFFGYRNGMPGLISNLSLKGKSGPTTFYPLAKFRNRLSPDNIRVYRKIMQPQDPSVRYLKQDAPLEKQHTFIGDVGRIGRSLVGMSQEPYIVGHLKEGQRVRWTGRRDGGYVEVIIGKADGSSVPKTGWLPEALLKRGN